MHELVRSTPKRCEGALCLAEQVAELERIECHRQDMTDLIVAQGPGPPENPVFSRGWGGRRIPKRWGPRIAPTDPIRCDTQIYIVRVTLRLVHQANACDMCV